jgi:hypothetical protein
LALIDYLLREREDGLSLARVLHSDHGIPFILISRYLETTVTVRAMRLGACDVLDKQHLNAEVLRNAVDRALQVDARTSDWGNTSAALSPDAGMFDQSAPKKLAVVLVRACGFKKDPRTGPLVSRAGGLSPTTFRTLCKACSVTPHEARDLVRILRAISLSSSDGSPLLSHLSFGDERTARILFNKAGLQLSCKRVDLRLFFQAQRFVSTEREMMVELTHFVANSPLFQQSW